MIDEQKGKGGNVISEERQRRSQNLISESPFPYKNFVILDEHETSKRNSRVEPSSPYRSPSQVLERPVHKERVQLVMGEGKPPLPVQPVDCPAQTVDPRFAQQSMDCLHKLHADPRFAQHRARRHKLKGQSGRNRRKGLAAVGHTRRC